MNIIQRSVAAFKAFTSMQWGRTTSWFSMLLGSTTFDYRAAAGDGRSNAAVMACIRWAQRTLPEAPLQVVTRNRDGEMKPNPGHILQERLERPNPYYSGLHLLGAIMADLMLTGNAYVLKVRSRDRRVQQLWWAPAALMEPAWPDNDPTVFISHYEYTVEGNVVAIDPKDVIHLRDYMADPLNIRKGISPLASLWREVASDNEAANWTGSLLKNGAVPGVVISPEGAATANDEDLEAIKDKWVQRFGGDERGKPMVMGSPTNVQVLSFSPEQMNLRDVRIVPEERITAVLGIPAIVVGLGAGLQRSTFANYAEAREAAYESFVIPMQRLIEAELQGQLVPDFGDPATLRVRFDLSGVRVLQEDQDALHERARADLASGLITLNQALQMIGQDVLTGPEGDVRYLPSTVTVTPMERLIPPEPAEESVPSTSEDAPAGSARTGPRALAAAGARNGHAKAATGPALTLSESDLDRLSQVGPDDLNGADRFWRRVVDDDLDDLLDARPIEEGE